MSNYVTRLGIRSGIYRLLNAWTRPRQASSPHLDGLMSPGLQFPTGTELILFQDEHDPHRHELAYTSLRDLLTKNRAVYLVQREECDGRPAIKNRLVELAARAYLLPARVQATNSGKEFFSRQWTRLTNGIALRSSHLSTLALMQRHNNAPSCLHWVGITSAFRSLFKLSHLRPQPVLRL